MNAIGQLDSTKTSPAKVVVVDDDKALCELLCDRLNDEPDLSCAGVATVPSGAITLVREVLPHVIIVDISLGSGVDAINLVANLVALSPSSQVLIWTKWSDPSPERAEEFRRKVRAMRSGATDWIAKADGIDELVSRIRKAVRRGAPSRAAATDVNPLEASLDELFGSSNAPDGSAGGGTAGLTPAEARAAGVASKGLERGMTVEQIAVSLRMNIQTLRTHLRSIYAKWDVHSQAQFVAEARRRGLF